MGAKGRCKGKDTRFDLQMGEDMADLEEFAVIRWAVGIIGGATVFLIVFIVVGFPLRNMFGGLEPFDTIVRVVVPGGIAGYFAYRSFRRSVWPEPVDRPEGSCRQCGYDLTGNVSGVCPECGQKI
jgi:hypothetical protein